MVQNKQKGGPKAKLPRINKNDASWEKVKIKGNVVSEDGVGLEGLIGLEVLETYDPALVEMSKVGKSLSLYAPIYISCLPAQINTQGKAYGT